MCFFQQQKQQQKNQLLLLHGGELVLPSIAAYLHHWQKTSNIQSIFYERFFDSPFAKGLKHCEAGTSIRI